MINIHHFAKAGEIADEAALEQLQKQWATYQKLVDNNSLASKQTGELLHAALTGLIKPFAFIDIACGDAGQMKQALAGTKIAHYHGIDLSESALELAAKNLKNVPFVVQLDQIDFVEALTKRAEPADAAWCGLSIHHLSTESKLRLFEAIHRSTKDFLMIYEPTLAEGEDRDGYLARFRRVNRPAWNS
jgi:2-polyprenyl-3-methyl-5-hydroxy-6-metoxy-1,4-benzoquinol methylase